MYLPNYKNGSLVNLMATLAAELGGASPYGPLKDFNPEIFKGKNIILMVIDGLGYDFLKKQGRGSFLEKNVKLKITSVFPSTTSAGVTAFLTGLPVNQHGLAGWFLYLKELGLVSRILPFTTRAGRVPLKGKGIKFSDIFQAKSIFKKIKAVGYAIQHRDYADSAYSLASTAGAKRLSFNSAPGFFAAIKKALKEKTKRKFIYAYWDGLDASCHKYGCRSRETLKHFKSLDKRLEVLAGRLTDTVLVISADHGLIDTAPDKIIKAEDYPEFADALALPLCGEPRLAYCYVKAGMAARFENYVKKSFKKYCEIYKSEDLIKKNFFGLFKANSKLSDRVGDYTLIMKDNYVIKDFLKGEERKSGGGVHGGVSRGEMLVPLVIINK